MGKQAVLTFGSNYCGQLGTSSKRDVPKPRQIKNVQDTDSVLESGSVYFEEVSTGQYHTVLLSDNGQVYTTGSGKYGRLGHGNETFLNYPQVIRSLENIYVLQVSAGSYHTAVVTDLGLVYTFGCGEFGQLGHNNRDNCLVPKMVEALEPININQVSAGGFHTVVLTDNGEMYTFGDGYGQLSGEDIQKDQHISARVTPPALVEGLDADVKISQIAAGGQHTVALSTKGQVYTFGKGEHGRLGHGSAEHGRSPKMIEAIQDVVIKQVAAGALHTVLLSDDGKVYTTGYGECGRLGHGHEQNIFVPKLVEGLQTTPIQMVSAGGHFTVVLSEEGHVYTFGRGEGGQLGHGDHKDVINPKMINEKSLYRDLRIRKVSAGGYHTVILADVESNAVKFEDLQNMEFLVFGGYGTLYKAVYQGKTVAVKIFMCNEKHLHHSQELKIMSSLSHKNILRLIGKCTEKDRTAIITEFMPGGSLAEYLQANKDIGWDQKIRFCMDIASGMRYLHSRKIIHMDLKPDNLLLDSSLNIKIMDFGLSKIKQNSYTVTSIKGTPAYLPPEIVNGAKFDERCDVYSFAIIMWEILTGELVAEHLKREYSDLISSPLAIATQSAFFGLRPKIPAKYRHVAGYSPLPNNTSKEVDNPVTPETPKEGFRSDKPIPEASTATSEQPQHDDDSYIFETIISQYISLIHKCWAPNIENRPSFSTILLVLKRMHKKFTTYDCTEY